MTKITITDVEDVQQRTDAFLVKYFDNKYSRKTVQDLIDSGVVLINQKKQKSSYKLKLNDVVEFDEAKFSDSLTEDELIPWDFKLDIVFEDDDVIVVNKPKQMLSHPTKYDRSHTLTNALMAHCKNLSDIGGKDRLGIVHRLDKNTSGLIICAKNNEAHFSLAEQIRVKSAKRKYLAISIQA